MRNELDKYNMLQPPGPSLSLSPLKYLVVGSLFAFRSIYCFSSKIHAKELFCPSHNQRNISGCFLFRRDWSLSSIIGISQSSDWHDAIHHQSIIGILRIWRTNSVREAGDRRKRERGRNWGLRWGNERGKLISKWGV